MGYPIKINVGTTLVPVKRLTRFSNIRSWHNSGLANLLARLDAPPECLCRGILPNVSRVLVPWEQRHLMRRLGLAPFGRIDV